MHTLEFILTEAPRTASETQSTTSSADVTEESSDKTEDSDGPRTLEENDTTSEGSYSSTQSVVYPGSAGSGSNSGDIVAIVAFVLLPLTATVILTVMIGIVVYKLKLIRVQKRRKSKPLDN